MKVLNKKHCLWRNIYAPRPVFMSEIALAEAADWTAASLPLPLRDALQIILPGYPIDAGMGSAQLAAAIAQHFQLAGDVTPPMFGVHAYDREKHVAKIFFAAMDPYLAALSLTLAMQVVDALVQARLTAGNLSAYLDRCLEFVTRDALDQSTRAMVAEAERRGIPWFRINGAMRHIQLGHGEHLRRIFETLRSNESSIGRDFSRDKFLTFKLLSEICLPVGGFTAVRNAETALKAAAAIGYPIVLKPIRGKKGEHVFVNLRNPQELRAALAQVSGGEGFLLQSCFPGEDHRILIVDGKLVAAARRMPASIMGDGKHIITELVAIANRDPRRGAGFEKIMNFIELDGETDRVLAQQDLTRDSMPAQGEHVRLRATANISSGGTALDVTNAIHPENARAAIKAAKALGLTVAGVDFISPDISKSWREIGGGICEVNAVVGLRPHFLANPEMDILGPIIETVYPGRSNSRIPTAMITGSKGKSTTTKMLAAMLACAGHTVGEVTTDGVKVGGEQIATGDLAGYTGATIVLRDPTVTAASLETARGGMIKTGIYLDWCNVAALTNVEREQIEVDGIGAIEELAALKRKVLEAARDAVVLNADDKFCAAMAPDFSHIRTILFSKDASAPIVHTHTQNGGEAIVLHKGVVEIRKGSQSTNLIAVSEIASTMNGLIEINAVNAMAAAGLALGLGLSLDHVREALKRYDTSLENAGCRFSFVDGFPFKALFDRAAQAPAYATVLPFLKALPVTGKRICLSSHAGNRPYWSTQEGAEVLAGNFDHYICYDRVPYRRDKKPGEIAATIAAALKEYGVAPEGISIAENTQEAAQVLAGLAGQDDLVAVFCADAHGFVEKFRMAFEDAAKK